MQQQADEREDTRSCTLTHCVGRSRRRGEHLNCKRSYTEEELQAALRDIQSGKLGTRRAAVIYGIPRSTLRNKVYKLALERRTGHSSAKATPSEAAATLVTTTTTTTTVNGTGAKGSSASESLRQLLKSTITQKSLGKGGDREPANNCAEHGGLLDVPDASQLLSSLECTPALGPLFAQVRHCATNVPFATFHSFSCSCRTFQ